MKQSAGSTQRRHEGPTGKKRGNFEENIVRHLLRPGRGGVDAIPQKPRRKSCGTVAYTNFLEKACIIMEDKKEVPDRDERLESLSRRRAELAPASYTFSEADLTSSASLKGATQASKKKKRALGFPAYRARLVKRGRPVLFFGFWFFGGFGVGVLFGGGGGVFCWGSKNGSGQAKSRRKPREGDEKIVKKQTGEEREDINTIMSSSPRSRGRSNVGAWFGAPARLERATEEPRGGS